MVGMDRVPEILKEQIHDDENQENTFKQGFHHFMNGNLDEFGCIVLDTVSYAFRKIL